MGVGDLVLASRGMLSDCWAPCPGWWGVALVSALRGAGKFWGVVRG